MNSNAPGIVCFYHDIEQDFDSSADPEVCRDVVRRFAELEQRYGARATYDVVGKIQTEQPDLLEIIRAAHHEVAFHSHGHHRDWNKDYYAEEVALCRAASALPRGYRSPRSQWGRETLEALWENGFLWSAENEPRTPEPYFIHKGLVRLPILGDDWPAHTGRQSREDWVAEFRAAVDSRVFTAVGMHDCVAAEEPDAWLATWEEMLKIASKKGLQMLTFSEAADLFRRGAVARHYDLTAVRWNAHSQQLYRSKRFQELIRAEAEALDNPVVADLASAGGVQSFGITDICSRIYCVDNSPGMVDSVEDRAPLEGRLGELTATGLPDESCDMVFCVNAIEYVYEFEDLAEEIKRIAKPGATCLVAFPAEGGCPVRPPTCPPDRIQRYFTRDDVERFGARIGNGQIFGVQFDATEPASDTEEARYRQLDDVQPADKIPMFWVYVGTHEREAMPDSGLRLIPLDQCPFRFHAQRFDVIKNAWRDAKRQVPKPLKQVAKALLGGQRRR